LTEIAILSHKDSIFLARYFQDNFVIRASKYFDDRRDIVALSAEGMHNAKVAALIS
jgi:hypothetical protein